MREFLLFARCYNGRAEGRAYCCGEGMQLSDAIDSFVESRRQADCAGGTLALYRRQLGHWRRWREARGATPALAEVALPDVAEFLIYLHDDYVHRRGGRLGANARSSYYRTLRAFWRWCERRGKLSAEQARIFMQIDAPRARPGLRPATDETTMRRLLAACGDETEEGARMQAIVLLLFDSGARISELCGLRDEDVDLGRRRARVLGKGSKEGFIFWEREAGAALARYLLRRRGARGGDVPFFRGCSIRNNGGPITPDLVRAALKRIADDARVVLPKGAPLHGFRHGFARRAIAAGGDISSVSQLMRHANLETTMIYLRTDTDRLQDAYEQIFSRGRKERKPRGDAESHG